MTRSKSAAGVRGVSGQKSQLAKSKSAKPKAATMQKTVVSKPRRAAGRAASAGQAPPPSTGGPSYHCDYCQTPLQACLRIVRCLLVHAVLGSSLLLVLTPPLSHPTEQRCAECRDFDLCLDCFAVGAQLRDHKNTHAYRVMVRGA